MDILLVWQEVCAFIRRMGSPIPARYVVAGFRNKMRNKMEKRRKTEYMEKTKKLGIGIAFVVIGIFFVVLMIAWLLYNIFIFSKG